MSLPKSLIPFLLLSIIHIIGQFLEITLIHDASKPLLIPSLGYYFYMSCIRSPLNKFIYAVLFLSWLGDCFLIFVPVDHLFFLLGLGAFLLAQIVYIIINLNFVNDGQTRLIFKWPSVLVILYGMALFLYLVDDLGEMTIPVAIYAAVITMMGVTAFSRIGRTEHRKAAIMVFLGASSFIISDSIIAINTFSQPLDWEGPFVMTTYLLAQFLLVTGYLKFIDGLRTA